MNIFKWIHREYLDVKLSRLLNERKGAYQFGDMQYVDKLDENIDNICEKLGTTVDEHFSKNIM